MAQLAENAVKVLPGQLQQVAVAAPGKLAAVLEARGQLGSVRGDEGSLVGGGGATLQPLLKRL